MKRLTLEICVDSLGSSLAAEEGGAHRVELCASMPSGGITPSYGLIRAACSRLRIPVHVLVRPRAVDFIHTPDELEIMKRDILAAKDLGADAVVMGVLKPDRSVDTAAMARLIRAARPLSVTFHRAFDQVPDRGAALEDLVKLGMERVLTTGGTRTASGGRRRLGALVARASGRISVMAGGGINRRTVLRTLAESGVKELHVGSAVAASRRSGRGAFRAEESAVDAAKVESFLKLIGGRR